MRAVLTLTALIVLAVSAGAQVAGTPWLTHAPIKTGWPNPTAFIEIGDPTPTGPGRYEVADVAYAFATNFPGINIPPYGVLSLYPPYIFWFRPGMRFAKVGWSQNYYWTKVLASFPTLPTSLKGLQFDVQVLAHKPWNNGTVSRLSSKATFYLY